MCSIETIDPPELSMREWTQSPPWADVQDEVALLFDETNGILTANGYIHNTVEAIPSTR